MKLLTLARDLKRRKAREREHLFVSEGVRAVEELLRSSLAIRGALVAPQLAETPRGVALLASLRARGVSLEEVPGKDFGSAAETESPQGVIAIAGVPTHSFATLDPTWRGVALILDGVQDPGNVGTILRTAAALGAACVVALPGTVDLWNAKVVRSGMGAQFRQCAFSTTWHALDAFLTRDGVDLWAADVHGDPVASVKVPGRVALVVGNEGAGLSAEARVRAKRTVSLPIAGDVESLNVAVATGILLYLVTR